MLDKGDIENRYRSIPEDSKASWVAYIKQMRADMRGTYSTPEGVRILTRMVKDSGIFTDTGEDTSRNFVIRILESMGILDEDNIEQIVRYMLKNTPIMPKMFMDKVVKNDRNRSVKV